MTLWYVDLCVREERCLKEFETSYAPHRIEVVYCEECYNQEVI